MVNLSGPSRGILTILDLDVIVSIPLLGRIVLEYLAAFLVPDIIYSWCRYELIKSRLTYVMPYTPDTNVITGLERD
jgi:hypothetical protein